MVSCQMCASSPPADRSLQHDIQGLRNLIGWLHSNTGNKRIHHLMAQQLAFAFRKTLCLIQNGCGNRLHDPCQVVYQNLESFL
jgi:hypothetical protein